MNDQIAKGRQSSTADDAAYCQAREIYRHLPKLMEMQRLHNRVGYLLLEHIRRSVNMSDNDKRWYQEHK